MQTFFDYLGNELELPTAKVKIPPVFTSVLSTEIVLTCPVVGDVQACCANGNMIYYADITNKTINRYDVLNDTLTSVSQPTIDHGNGMTYCDLDNCIYVATANSKDLLKINADTLALVDTLHPWHEDPSTESTTWAYTSVCYNRSTKEFYFKCGASIFHIYDSDFNYLRRITLENHPADSTGQSIETDGSCIYFVWCEGTSYYTDNRQHIYVYTLDGKFLKDVKPMCSEAESLAYNGYGDYYISCCRGSSNNGIIRKVVNPFGMDLPTTNGTYVLKATVSNGYISYAWTAET